MTKMPGYPCAICSRESQGIVISLPGKRLKQFCSHDCARIFMTIDKLTQNERAAATKGGEEAGAFLDAIGKTDLAALSPEEWEKFCAALFKGACDELRRQADDTIPF